MTHEAIAISPLLIIAPPEPLFALLFVIIQPLTERVLKLWMAAPFPVVLPFARTRLERLFVVPAAKVKRGKAPPPLITVGTVAPPMMATLFVIVGNANPSVIIFVSVILI